MSKDAYLVWIFAGETSGDKYGAGLAFELKRSLGDRVKLAGMGSKAMRDAGVDILVDSTELGVVGFIEIMKHIFTFLGIFFGLVRRAAKDRPDAVVLIDYPGFNLRFAKQMYRRGIPVIWYVSPQVWAWGKHRIPKLAKYCRGMMVIFPFETEVYAGTGLEVEFVGHPLVDIVREKLDFSIASDPNKFLFLPGSRSNEIHHMMVPMLRIAREVAGRHPDMRFYFSAARPALKTKIEKAIADYKAKNGDVLPPIEVVYGENPRLLRECCAGMCSSGTITVETAIAGMPMVVAYIFNWITFLAALILVRKLFRGFFTMTNIIANKRVYEEFLQFQVTPKRVGDAIERILPGGDRREEVLADIRDVAENQLTFGKENAHANAAKAVIRTLEKLAAEKN